MRRAEQFAQLLEAPAGAAAGGPGAELVALTEALAALPRPELRADAASRIRQRLVAVAAVQSAEPEKPARAIAWRHRRLATIAVGSLSAVTAVTGVAMGASRALPGQPLYGLKRATEAVQLRLADGPAAKGQRELEFAATRLAELRAIGTQDSHAAGLLHDMSSEITAGHDDLIQAARADHSTAPVLRFESFARSQWSALIQLAQSAPPSLLPPLRTDVIQIGRLDASARSVVASISGSKSSPGHPHPVPSGGHVSPGVGPSLPIGGHHHGGTPGPTSNVLPTPGSSGRTTQPGQGHTGSPTTGPLPTGKPSLPSLPSLPSASLPNPGVSAPVAVPTNQPTLLPTQLPSVVKSLVSGLGSLTGKGGTGQSH